MAKYAAVFTTRNEIRDYIWRMKRYFGLEYCTVFPIVKFAENMLPQVLPDLSLEIISNEEWGYGDNVHAKSYPDEMTIQIREDIYRGAALGNKRDRMTLAHEVCHILCHKQKYLMPWNDTDLIPKQEDPEWQANVFAGELLAPSYLIKGKTVDEVANEFQVSRQAAETQLFYTDY